jgi:spermidine synthase
MKPFELLGQTLTPDGTEVKLVRRDDEYIMLAGGKPLMSSRTHGSEQALATIACQQVRTIPQSRVLIGGLGMGFTLRTALDALRPDAEVVVAELVPAVVEWNQGPLGPLAKKPLADPRVRIAIADVGEVLRESRGRFDAVLLDVDNGPVAFSSVENARLYSERGLAAARNALKPRGVLAIWSAQEDRKFEQRLRRGKFEVRVEHLRGRLKKGGPRHVIYLGQRSARPDS